MKPHHLPHLIPAAAALGLGTVSFSLGAVAVNVLLIAWLINVLNCS